MTTPTPGIQKRGTFSSLTSVVHKVTEGKTLLLKYGNLMFDRFRGKSQNGPVEIGFIPSVSNPGVQDVNWVEFQKLRIKANRKAVLAFFYKDRVCFPLWFFIDQKSSRCQEANKIFHQLIEYVDSNKIVLAKVNINKNCQPFEIYRLPTILLHKEGSPHPIEYFDDPLSLKALLRFLREEGSFIRTA